MIVRYYPFVLELRAPALLTGLEGDPNSAFTLDHIPGSVLRGAVAGSLDARGDRATFDALVLDGTVRYLHAWPARKGRRGVPMPLSFRAEKGTVEAETLHDLAYWDGRPGDDHDVGPVWPEVQLSDAPAGCVTLGASPLRRVEVERSSRVHQQRDRVRGRAWTRRLPGKEEAVGTIFTYESLDAGQSFAGVLLVKGDTDAACEAHLRRVQGALRTPLLLGRSRRAGYGGDAEVVWEAPRPREYTGVGVLDTSVKAGQEVRVLLTSPCIARSERSGQIDPRGLPEQLVARLGGRVRVLRRRWGFTQVGGFNRHWGLELPQALAVRAGSVLVLEAIEDLALDELVAVEHEGLGERRVEGFGRVCFLAEATETCFVARPDPQTPVSPTPVGKAPALVSWLEARLLAQALDTHLEERGAEIAESVSHPPTRSLLGRLRGPLRGDPALALKTLGGWLGEGDHALRRTARRQLDRCRIGPSAARVSLSQWIRQLVEEAREEKIVDAAALAQRWRIVSEASARAWLDDRGVASRVRLLDLTLAAIARKLRPEEVTREPG